MKAITVIRRITGSANMKIGIEPEVRVTKAEDRITRLIPDERIISPVCSLGFFHAIR
jgi:hypothetical protein